MKELIHYNDYIKGTNFSNFSFSSGSFSSWKDRSSLFFNGKYAKCKYCHTKMEEIINDTFENKGWSGKDYYHRSDIVKKCPNCGWWDYKHLYNYGSAFSDEYENTIYRGIIKTFKINDKKLPISILNMEVEKKPQLLYKVNSLTFENFVKNLFEDFYQCEVIHCGKTGDGGIDLMIINSDNPILVQVKCRTEKTARYGEPIKAIREFLGALFINQSKQGIYVTTSKKFSKNTIEIQNDILKRRVITKFDLIDFDKLISIFRLNKKKTLEPWKKLVNQDKIFHRP